MGPVARKNTSMPIEKEKEVGQSKVRVKEEEKTMIEGSDTIHDKTIGLNDDEDENEDEPESHESTVGDDTK